MNVENDQKVNQELECLNRPEKITLRKQNSVCNIAYKGEDQIEEKGKKKREKKNKKEEVKEKEKKKEKNEPKKEKQEKRKR